MERNVILFISLSLSYFLLIGKDNVTFLKTEIRRFKIETKDRNRTKTLRNFQSNGKRKYLEGERKKEGKIFRDRKVGDDKHSFLDFDKLRRFISARSLEPVTNGER